MEIDFSKLDEHSESETLELKESFDNKALETIGAFANTNGGTILIGVRDDGRVIGITVGKNTLEEMAQKMQFKIQSRILPSIHKHSYKQSMVVEITVARSDSPITVDGRFFKRVGRTNQLIGSEELRQRLFASSGTSWDAQIDSGAQMEDLDDKTVDTFISLIKAAGRRPVGSEGTTEILTKLELVKNGLPTRAAILLLGNRPYKFFLSAMVQLGRFKSLTHIVDDKRLDGNILEQIEEGMIWFQQRFETEFIITGKPRRDEKWEYPLLAVREALINALCHREYTAASNTQVRLYDDHVEIWNPGGLLIPLTPEQLFQEHPSLRRNPLIAQSLFYAGFIESWGGGTLRIIELAKEASNLEIPEFVSHSGEFRFILRKRVLTRARLEKMGLNERQVTATLHIVESGRITNREYQERLLVSRATAGRELGELVEKGILLRHGESGKNIFYTLVSANASNAS